MGGCRCSYRNCTLRTDGKTHMFHYPVFDKVRCHQWLTNAHKLEFLNLKVSQLKNRVVCQHHFKDENFMNFRKDKLTFDAVPTEDGPFCDSSQFEEKKPEQDDTKAFSISLDDIENEYLTITDKKANFSVKYGDFLTNGDLMDLNSLNQMNNNTQVAFNGLYVMEPCFQGPKDLIIPSGPVKSFTHINRPKISENHSNIILNNNSNRKNIINKANPVVDKSLDVSTISETPLPPIEGDQNSMNLMVNVSLVPIEFEESKFNELNKQNVDQLSDSSLFVEPKPPIQSTNRSLLKPSKKIRIISEKKISEPMSVVGKLEPVSPTKVLNFPNKKNKVILNSIDNNSNINTNNIVESKSVVMDTIENNVILEKPICEPTKIIKIEKTTNVPPHKVIGNVTNATNNEVSPKTLLIKKKIPPERVAAIAEKRKFNMKLRDIIKDCLDKLDEPDKSDYDKRKLSHKLSTEKSKKEQVGSYLGNEAELPHVHEYNIAYFEARMKKMENNLVNKIDQNSRRILELTQALAPTSDTKTVHTQTSISEEQHKKQLYREVSQYLSRDTSSLLYEELFINKFTQQVPKLSSSTKRRKYR